MNLSCARNLRTEIVTCKNGETIYTKISLETPHEGQHSNNLFRHYQSADASYPAPQSGQSDTNTWWECFLDFLSQHLSVSGQIYLFIYLSNISINQVTELPRKQPGATAGGLCPRKQQFCLRFTMICGIWSLSPQKQNDRGRGLHTSLQFKAKGVLYSSRNSSALCQTKDYSSASGQIRRTCSQHQEPLD